MLLKAGWASWLSLPPTDWTFASRVRQGVIILTNNRFFRQEATALWCYILRAVGLEP